MVLGHFKHLWDTFQWLGCQHFTLLFLEGYCTSLSEFFKVYLICGRRWGKNLLLGRFVVGGLAFEITISKTI